MNINIDIIVGGTHVHILTHHGKCMEVRGQHAGVRLLWPRGFWEVNSDHQTWQQTPLLAAPSCHPQRSMLSKEDIHLSA